VLLQVAAHDRPSTDGTAQASTVELRGEKVQTSTDVRVPTHVSPVIRLEFGEEVTVKVVRLLEDEPRVEVGEVPLEVKDLSGVWQRGVGWSFGE
jgi:hypothetical protein